MSIYATIQFKMKNGQKAPVLYDSQCGEFRDTTLELIKIYDKKHEIKKLSQSITLSGKELVEFGKLYADEVECEEINFLIRNIEDEAETKKISVCDYYKNGEFQIDDNKIVGYNCNKAQAFMPVYNLYKHWAWQDALDGDVDIENNLPIFKHYVQLTLEGN